QLSAAADRLFMLETFRSHLKAVSGKDVFIENCAPFRFRCRQHRSRHVLQYTLRVTEPATGRRSDQWVTGVLCARAAPERTYRRLEKMKAQAHHLSIPQNSLTFDPIAFIPSLQMIVQVYPYDRKLTSLGHVADGAVEGLDPLLLGRLGPGNWS